MTTGLYRADQYRERAEELRAIADDYHDKAIREQLYSYAAQYEAMAQKVENLVAAQALILRKA